MTKEEKLLYLGQLAQLDPFVVILPHIISLKDFGKLMKTFAGKTLTFPTMQELNQIISKTSKIRGSLRAYVKNKDSDTLIRELFDFALSLESRDVRKSVKVMITEMILKEYFKSIIENDSFNISVDTLEKLDVSDAIELYGLFLKDLKMRNGILNSVSKLKLQSKDEK